MPNGEMRIVGKNTRVMYIIAAALVFVLGIFVRKQVIWYVSREWTLFFEEWIRRLSEDGFRALADDFYDYAPMYMYLLFVPAQFGAKGILVMKMVNICFDFLLAVAGAAIVYVSKKSEFLTTLAFSVLWLAPTVISDSSMWGQCDGIYASFILISLLFVMMDRSRLSCIALGIAFAFKLQTVFIFPVVILLWLYKRIKTQHLLYVPLIYILSIIPVWIAGRPLSELLGIYSFQKEEYSMRLSLKFPNIYYIIGETYNIDIYTTAGQFFAIAVLLVFMVAIVQKCMKTKLTPEFILLISYTSMLLVLYFMPEMHERYGYVAEAIGMLLVLFKWKRFWVPMVQILCTYVCYSYYYNFDQPKILPYYVLSLFMLGVLIYMVYETFSYEAPADALVPCEKNDRDKETVAAS
ncbi:MAG: hypothetical protein K6G07_08970 [Lachnospiraceae bacterium]|nr:hypothetical protein [Lachnospiraceae bacterium]